MARLKTVVPVALLLTLGLLFNAFGSFGLAVLTLANGSQIAGEDLKRLVREAASVEALCHRLNQRAGAQLLEQSTLAGALASGAQDRQAEAAATRLNALAEEGEASWTGRFDPDHALVLERVVRGVTERVVMDSSLLNAADTRRLADRAPALMETYAGPAKLTRGSDVTDVRGPLSLHWTPPPNLRARGASPVTFTSTSSPETFVR